MKLFIIILTSIALIPANVFSHGGGLDANGGHYNRKTGVYHQHRGSASESAIDQKSVSVSKSSSSSSSSYQSNYDSVSPSERSQKINAYFRSANENVGALDCDLVIHERNLDTATKNTVKRRDGNRCVICGSTVKLEVDHMRGLQNGGSNEPSNLATLCDDCHTEKTRMDNSLRRKRERVCRGN